MPIKTFKSLDFFFEKLPVIYVPICFVIVKVAVSYKHLHCLFTFQKQTEQQYNEHFVVSDFFPISGASVDGWEDTKLRVRVDRWAGIRGGQIQDCIIEEWDCRGMKIFAPNVYGYENVPEKIVGVRNVLIFFGSLFYPRPQLKMSTP